MDVMAGPQRSRMRSVAVRVTPLSRRCRASTGTCDQLDQTENTRPYVEHRSQKQDWKQRLGRKPLQFCLRQHGITGASMEAASTQDMEALYRSAVGAKKADFYVPKFVGFDQPGASRLSWNWPAFFFSFYWFLYRRMYATWA